MWMSLLYFCTKLVMRSAQLGLVCNAQHVLSTLEPLTAVVLCDVSFSSRLYPCPNLHAYCLCSFR